MVRIPDGTLRMGSERGFPLGEEEQPRRVLRGGAWDMDLFRCRSAYRSFDWKDLATDRFGLRIAIDP